jgi:hypothetical protein
MQPSQISGNCREKWRMWSFDGHLPVETPRLPSLPRQFPKKYLLRLKKVNTKRVTAQPGGGEPEQLPKRYYKIVLNILQYGKMK